MTLRMSIHVEAPVEKVFEFFEDPGHWKEVEPEGIDFKDVRLTSEGVGTYYSWKAKVAGLPIEGFGVFTEFVPNERITDKSSRAFEGTWRYLFEPEGSGTKLTIESEVRSFWRLPPLQWMLDLAAGKSHGPRMERLKAKLEA